MQLEFYIEGSEPGLKGTVHVESKEVGVYIPEAIFECLTDITGPQDVLRLNCFWMCGNHWFFL